MCTQLLYFWIICNCKKLNWIKLQGTQFVCLHCYSSSSSCATTSIFECLVLLNIWFPLIMILNAANPILYFQFLHVIAYVIFPSVLCLPCGHSDISFHLHTFFTFLSSGIRCKWPSQLKCCAFIWFIKFPCLINSSNSSFVLILHVPSLSFVGPNIFLNTFLSNTINLFFMVSFKTITSQAYVTIGLEINFWIYFSKNTQ